MLNMALHFKFIYYKTIVIVIVQIVLLTMLSPHILTLAKYSLIVDYFVLSHSSQFHLQTQMCNEM